jgi:hypothetical protein
MESQEWVALQHDVNWKKQTLSYKIIMLQSVTKDLALGQIMHKKN